MTFIDLTPKTLITYSIFLVAVLKNTLSLSLPFNLKVHKSNASNKVGLSSPLSIFNELIAGIHIL